LSTTVYVTSWIIIGLLHTLQGLQNITTGRANIGIKRMGELDLKSIVIALKRKLSKEDAEVTAAILCSEWQADMNKLEWHPFRVVMVDGKQTVWISFLFYTFSFHNNL
jgi:hypothetical protein